MFTYIYIYAHVYIHMHIYSDRDMSMSTRTLHIRIYACRCTHKQTNKIYVYIYIYAYTCVCVCSLFNGICTFRYQASPGLARKDFRDSAMATCATAEPMDLEQEELLSGGASSYCGVLKEGLSKWEGYLSQLGECREAFGNPGKP